MDVNRILPTALQQVTPEVRAARLAICEACPSLQRQPIKRCGECGCPIASKTRFKQSSCPLGKWSQQA